MLLSGLSTSVYALIFLSVVVSVEGMAAIAAGGKKALRTHLKRLAKEVTSEVLKVESRKCCELLFSTDIYKVSYVCLIWYDFLSTLNQMSKFYSLQHINININLNINKRTNDQTNKNRQALHSAFICL